MIRFRTDFLPRYLIHAPVPLALERSLECEILSRQEFRRPVLDIGCGDGLFASILFDEKIDAGIDPNKRELDRARELGAYEELIQCFGESIPKGDQSYNTITTNSALEHVVDPEPVLREAHRLLSADGSLYITVPTDLFDQYTVVNVLLTKLRMHSLSKRFRRLYNKFWSQPHHYPPDEWASLFRKSGFDVVQTIQYDSRETCLLNDSLVPFSFPSWLTKKLFNRWTFASPLRKAVAHAVMLVVHQQDIEAAIGIERGGLVFFKLRKSATTGLAQAPDGLAQGRKAQLHQGSETR